MLVLISGQATNSSKGRNAAHGVHYSHLPIFLSRSLKAASSSWPLVFPCSLSRAAINSWFHRSSAINSSFCSSVAMRSSSMSRLRSILASVPGGMRRNIGGSGPSMCGTHFLRTAKGMDSSSRSLKKVGTSIVIQWKKLSLDGNCVKTLS